MNSSKTFGKWFIEYDLEDGGRIKRLCFDGFDLLTTEPADFKPPVNDFGKFETRPVYGYDDCFPSVESCIYPTKKWMVPDHGELCWLPWKGKGSDDYLVFSVKSQELPIVFKRTLFFEEKRLTWLFEVENHGEDEWTYQHVMHPLLDIENLTDVKLPNFKSVIDEAEGDLGIKSPEKLRDFLFSIKSGEARMLYLLESQSNTVQWMYKNGMQVEVSFPLEIFSSLGIWWDNWGYPDEEGHRRCECAFEPIAGITSKLDEAFEAGLVNKVAPGHRVSWKIYWQIKRSS